MRDQAVAIVSDLSSTATALRPLQAIKSA